MTPKKIAVRVTTDEPLKHASLWLRLMTPLHTRKGWRARWEDEFNRRARL